MDAVAVLGFIKDYGDLAIGLALVLAAAAVLPGRMKAYVLTAGLAVIAVQGYIRMTNRKRLAEADKLRDELRDRAGQLDRRRAELEGQVADLNRQLGEARVRQTELNQQAAGLQQRGGAVSAEAARVNEEAERNSKRAEELLQSTAGMQDLLAKMVAAKDAQDELERSRN